MESRRDGYDAGVLHRLYKRDEVICKRNINQMSHKGDKNRLRGEELKKFGESKLWKNIEKKKKNNKGSK